MPRKAPPTGSSAVGSYNLARQLQLALNYFRNRQLSEANAILQRLAKDHPREPVVNFHYGNLLWSLNQPSLAARHYQAAIESRPDFTDAIANLGAALWVLGEQKEAIKYYQKVIKLDPTNTRAYYNLGGAYFQQGKANKAVTAFRKVINIDPGFSDAYRYLGNTYYEQGHTDKALKCYRKVAELAPSGGASVRLVSAIPMIPDSMQHLHEIRRRLNDGLDDLLSRKIHIDDPVQENGFTNFFLAYHGEDDRPIQEKYTQLYLQCCPSLNYTAQHCLQYQPSGENTKIKIGFISRYLTNHSIGNTSKGVIAKLSRDIFDVTTIFLSPPRDETARFIEHHSDHTLVLPDNLASAREALARLELDILFHQDTGMDPFTFFLCFSRLAPIQCTSFGHPVTTGIPNLDYYISTDLWEPEDADSHYSEKLAKLRGVASVAYYYKPQIASLEKTRNDFCLHEQDNLYICPQTLFKFHPEFDQILQGILRADQQGKIILLEGKHRSWSEILRRRFKRYIPDVAKRIIFLPRQPGKDFINLIKVCNVMLDTIHFCGFNTSLQGFAVGTPVVTLPGRFMRSRHTMSFYQKMEYPDLIAKSPDDYVSIAVRLGTDPGAREQASHEVSMRSEVLWQEEKVIEEFEKFFMRAVEQLRQ